MWVRYRSLGGGHLSDDMYRNGHLKLDELVTRRYRLDQINDAITDMREGRNIRGVIEFD